MPLKYLFTAEYADGSSYEQNPQDESLTKPGKGSSFTDVDQDHLVKFTLKGEGHTYAVYLIDGHFEVDGVAFRMHETDLVGFRVIFFRQHTHSFNVGAEKNEEMSHEIVYRLGWQCTDGGENYQQVMQIS